MKKTSVGIAVVVGLLAVVAVLSQETQTNVVRDRILARIKTPPLPNPPSPIVRPVRPAGWAPQIKEEKIVIGPVPDIRVNVDDPAWIVFQRPIILSECDRLIAAHPGDKGYLLRKVATVKKLEDVVAASLVVAATDEMQSLKVLQAMEFWRTNRIDVDGKVVSK